RGGRARVAGRAAARGGASAPVDFRARARGPRANGTEGGMTQAEAVLRVGAFSALVGYVVEGDERFAESIRSKCAALSRDPKWDPGCRAIAELIAQEITDYREHTAASAEAG